MSVHECNLTSSVTFQGRPLVLGDIVLVCNNDNRVFTPIRAHRVTHWDAQGTGFYTDLKAHVLFQKFRPWAASRYNQGPWNVMLEPGQWCFCPAGRDVEIVT